ncbi:MAG: prealbumin-like fold domain-containing protein [Thomasclavelia ramosa]
MKLIKTNEDKQMLDGAVFNLKGKNNDYNQHHVVKNGVLQIDNLLVGDYILTEIKTPADHDSLNKEYTVTIKVMK